jgi:hypothetical protein
MFAVVRASSWEMTRQISQLLVGWAFRGHGDERWPLETTLYRGAKLFGYDVETLGHAESWMLREFQRRAHHYVSDLPPLDQRLEWLGLIQHFGGPTRLLDFSYSFYVAAFFAVERAENDAAVWAINLDALEELTARKMNVDRESENIASANKRHIDAFLNARESKPLVVNMEPERLNERLSIQQGLFLFPCDLSMPLEAILAQSFGQSHEIFAAAKCQPWNDIIEEKLASGELSVLKLILSRSSHRSAIDDLRSMNITSATLFPGLDGFARSLYYYLRAAEAGDEIAFPEIDRIS